MLALIAVDLSTVTGNDLLQPPQEVEERDGWVDKFGKKWNWDGCLNGKKNMFINNLEKDNKIMFKIRNLVENIAFNDSFK